MPISKLSRRAGSAAMSCLAIVMLAATGQARADIPDLAVTKQVNSAGGTRRDRPMPVRTCGYA